MLSVVLLKIHIDTDTIITQVSALRKQKTERFSKISEHFRTCMARETVFMRFGPAFGKK